MRPQYVGDITFWDICTVCMRRIHARSLLVLNHELDEHEVKCKAEYKAKLLKRLHEANVDSAQGKLF